MPFEHKAGGNVGQLYLVFAVESASVEQVFERHVTVHSEAVGDGANAVRPEGALWKLGKVPCSHARLLNTFSVYIRNLRGGSEQFTQKTCGHLPFLGRRPCRRAAGRSRSWCVRAGSCQSGTRHILHGIQHAGFQKAQRAYLR
jgi:hypothetical protein